ncbi:retron St85 family RNA-directed DNA polymerase [Achromobacter mucicolens]|uniref:retron St85 family RNA-directed DNA polymerase n=1 Tax=Achromobacter mucicolens TaxID=1389922 RepID=UPI0028ABEFE0|nr:retron St85 family RNA-directed DNA polymerase [Achromobacter mucicolens]
MKSLISLAIEELPFSEREIRELLNSAPARYKVHYIEKRKGRGLRQIAQPTAEIKLLQRWAVSKYRDILPVHSAAKAYIIGSGIQHHAGAHSQNSYLLKLDFKDFFPSIKGIDVRRHLAKHLGSPSEELSLLTKLFCWRGKPATALHLSIGAPSSPFISNSIMFEMDSAIELKCAEYGAAYTRYADDLAISTNQPNSLSVIHNFIQELCRESKFPHFELNPEKTVFTSKKNHRHLTGITLANDGKLSLGREKKRLIRAMAHAYSIGKLNPQDFGKLRGWIAFASSVEPAFVQVLERMVGSRVLDSIRKGHGTWDT